MNIFLDLFLTFFKIGAFTFGGGYAMLPLMQEEVLAHIKGLIKSVITPQVTAIGMGVPAVVDLETGTVYDVVAIPSWKEVPV